MSTVSSIPLSSVFESGDRMSREEFHRLYEETPDDFKAELIGGIVYVASPLRRRHGTVHLRVAGILASYNAATPGVEAADNATVLLGAQAEPQPDLLLRILPEYGGRTDHDEKDYIVGPPELVIEIAHSRRSIDLHTKYDDYAEGGVLEYIVVCPDEQKAYWFDLDARKDIPPEPDAVIRVRTFPGLGIDGMALLAGNQAKLLATAQAGLATEEHAAFVKQLESQRRGGG